MASINLIPNIPVIVGQGVVFGTAIYVVNKLILKPYSKLREHRDSLTTGSQSQAKSMFQEIETKSLEIKEKRTKALDDAVAIRTSHKDKASKEANSILEASKEKASNEITKLKEEITANFKDEAAKISSVANKISSEIFEAAIN